MRAAIYCRLSKEDRVTNGESESIQNQKSMLIQYAIEKGLDIYQIYSDEDYSGVDRSRPAFNAMIQDASEHKFDVVIAKTQSRFTRDMELVERYLHGKFPEWGIRFIAVVDHADTADQYNKKARQINGLINEWYLEDLSENVRSVMRHKQLTGQFIGSFAPYGYAKDPNDHNHLVIDPEAAVVVRRIFQMAIQGHGYRSIVSTLNSEGVPNPTMYKRMHGDNIFSPHDKGQTQGLWSVGTIYLILHREIYIGNLVQGKQHRVSYKSKKIKVLPKSQWIVVPDTHEPIISKEDFEMVQMMRSSGHASQLGTMTRPLFGLVRCACCGSVMSLNGRARETKEGGPFREFRCPLHIRAPHLCRSNCISMLAVEKMVQEKVQELVRENLEPDSPAMRQIEEQWMEHRGNGREELERVQEEIRQRENILKSLYQDRCNGVLDQSQFKELQWAYTNEKNALEQRLQKLEGALADTRSQEEHRKAFQEKVRSIGQVETMSRELAFQLMEAVRVWPKEKKKPRKVEIIWRF